MALTKIPRGLLDTGIADSSDATAITIDSSENVTTAAALATGGNLTVNGNTNLTGNLTVDSTTLYVDSSNNRVGIGTTSPSFDLEINKASAAAAVLINSGNNDAMLRLYTANNVGKWRVIATTSDDNLSIQNLNSGASAFNNRMTFTDAGNVGLGGQTAPKEVLNVAGAGVFEGDHSTGVNAMNAGTGVLVHASGSVGYITATSNGSNNRDLQIRALNAGGANAGQLTLLHTGASTFTGPAAATLTVKSTDGAGSTPGPHLILRRDSASPADGDDVGELQWIGKNNAGQDVTLAMMRTWNRSVTDGSEGASFGLYDMQGGTQTGILFADNNTIHLNHSGVARPIQFRGEGSVYSRIAHHSYGMSFETTTSDGSDSMSVSLDAGSGGGSTSRGAFFGCYGNEASSYGGSIVGQMGAAGHFKLLGGSGADSLFNLNPGGALGLEKSSSRFIVGTAYNVSGLYATGSTSAIGIFGANAYSSCGAHIETATDADSGWSPIYINKFDWASGDDARWISFGVNGYTTDYGTIEFDGTNFAIVNASDYRLKENIVDYSGGLAKVEELKVRTYNKKEGVSKHITQQGFIAHEAATANIPGFISGEKDAMKTNEAGETVPDYQTVNKEALIPYLVSAIQELSAKVKELESK